MLCGGVRERQCDEGGRNFGDTGLSLITMTSSPLIELLQQIQSQPQFEVPECVFIILLLRVICGL